MSFASSQGKKHLFLIFRQNLFRTSETFIALQTQNLAHYRPLYMGRVQWGKSPTGQKSLSIWPFPFQKPAFKTVKNFLFSLFSLSPKPWLALLAPEEKTALKLIHAHFGPDAVRALFIAKSLRLPLITNFHGFDATLKDWRFLLSPVFFPYPFLKKRLAREGDLFLCPSHFLKERVLKMGFPPERTFVHHIGIDLAQFSLRPPEKEKKYLLHVARLVPVKGTEILLKAFYLLPKRHKDTQLFLLGDGPLRQKLENLSKELGLSERVFFLGACSHETVKKYTSEAAIAILPSVPTPDGRVEGLGLSLVEAAASGVPVIGSDCGGIPEAMIEGETGLLFPPGDAPALAEKITSLLDNKTLRIKMGQAGRKFAEKEFSLKTQNKILEAFYNSLL